MTISVEPDVAYTIIQCTVLSPQPSTNFGSSHRLPGLRVHLLLLHLPLLELTPDFRASCAEAIMLEEMTTRPLGWKSLDLGLPFSWSCRSSFLLGSWRVPTLAVLRALPRLTRGAAVGGLAVGAGCVCWSAAAGEY